jgi:hypothetical protein
MGGLLSVDLCEDVRNRVAKGRARTNEIRANFPRDCSRIQVADCSDRTRVYDFALSTKNLQVIQTEELDPESHRKICASVQDRETRRLELLDHIHDTMERYCWVLDLLVNGDFCALRSIADASVKRWDLKRQDDAGVRFTSASCPGVYIDRLIERSQREAEGQDVRLLYDMRSPENRDWQELINTFTDAMSRGIRLLGGCERALSARNTLKIDVLQNSRKRVADAELGVDVALQHFLKRILDDLEPGQAYVRPYSVKEVEALRMQNAIRDRTEREQERAVSAKAREEGRRVRQTAEATWNMPGAQDASVRDANHQYKQS